ncbi:MAG: alpha/beta hydrolase [Planctomycetota bacterium]
MFGNIVANTFIKPFQSPVFDDPKNYDLDYEDVTFDASDGVTLSGWLVKGSSDKVIIQSHFGVQCSRSGYRPHGMLKGYDKDIEFLRQAKYLNEAGYSVLMYDFRNHGNSGVGTIPFITWADEEAKDVIAAVDFICQHPDYRDSKIGLLSICMGQGASICAFGRDDGLKRFPNLKTMISVQPMDYGCFVHALGLPEFLIRGVDRAIKRKTGKDYNETTWRPLVKEVSVPTLVIQNRNDGYLDEAFVNGVYDDLTVEKEMLWIEIPKKKGGAFPNRAAAYDWLGENPEPILGWFNKFVL